VSRSPGYSRLAGSPVLVGATTTLVAVVAVFLSYNANAGLPFVPTYDLTAQVPNAVGLVKGNEVRIGGKRAGVIKTIDAAPGPDGRAIAKLSLKLDKVVEPLRADSRIIVRPRSPLGLKYLELTPGKKGKPLPGGGLIPLRNSTRTVELEEVLNTFDAATREGAKGTIKELGDAFTGRGADFNEFLSYSPSLLRGLERVAANLSDRRTGLSRFIHAVDRTVGELATVTPQLGDLVTAANVTLGALASVRGDLDAVIAESPPTEEAGIRALAITRPVLEDAAGLLRDVRPGAALLPLASRRLHLAFQTGIPVLRRATALAERLGVTLEAVRRLSADPLTLLALQKLLVTLRHAKPLLEYITPSQVQCNYLGLWTHNVPNTISEGDASGTWFRTLTVQQPSEGMASAEPAPGLHVDPYPHTASPGQGGECEAGNEPFLSGQQIGSPSGNQSHTTRNTTPPPGVPYP
jgi:phospholipid/cholesterol/gamma-HCH transport system substrate-binding protein